MNTNDDDQKAADSREDRERTLNADPFETEGAPAKEAAEVRETSERGYGWGV